MEIYFILLTALSIVVLCMPGITTTTHHLPLEVDRTISWSSICERRSP